MDGSSEFALDIVEDPSLLLSALNDACPRDGCLRRGIVSAAPSLNSSKSHKRFDYDEYTRYLNNLNCRYARIDRRAEITSTIRDLGKGHRGHSLSVYVDGVGQTLSLEEQKIIAALSEQCSRDNEAWIVMDLTLDIVYKSQVLPKSWVRAIIPYITTMDEVVRDDFLFWNIQPCEVLCKTCPTAQERAVTKRYLDLLDELLELYNRGSIVDCSEEFARDWQLEIVGYGIYQPTWWNTILTSGDPTLYLSRQEEGSSYEQEAAIAYERLQAMSDLQ